MAILDSSTPEPDVIPDASDRPLDEDPGSSGSRTGSVTCPYCGVGCVLNLTVKNGRMHATAADETVAPNYGGLCPKGAYVHQSDAPERRLTQPMIRYAKDQPLQPVTWDEAIQFIAGRFEHIRTERGPERLAWYGSGQLHTEASYLFTKLFKGFLGSNHTDTNSRLCMSSAVAGYRHSFGSDGPPCCYDDVPLADTFFVLGANMASNHPVLFNMLRKRHSASRSCKLIVVDPRRTRTAAVADLHLPVKPGGDVALLRLLARRLIEMQAINPAFIEAHTHGFAALRENVMAMDRQAMHEACGIEARRIDQAAAWMAGDRRLLSFYCMGANQSTRGTDKNTAIIDLHLLTGEVGRPGAGPFSLTGQPNAMGGREVGYLAHQLPGYRFVERAADRRTVETAWGLARGSIAPEPGLPGVAMFEAAAAGRFDALWIACTNPVVSMPDLAVTKRALRRTRWVIVQDCFADTETAAYADILLPAATVGETVGTMTNSERHVTRSQRLLDPPGEARPDWWMPAALGRAMGFHGFDFADAEQVWDEFRLLTRGTRCDMTGITNDRLQAGGVRWPCPDANHAGQSRLYLDRRFATPDQRARFSTAGYHAPAEPVTETFPLTLTTGRVGSHWHTRARTGNVPELNDKEPLPFAEIHPHDAAAFNITDVAPVRILTPRGTATVQARLTEDIQPGTVFVPFHWGDRFAPDSAANYLTHGRADAVSHQPELKHAACRLEPVPRPDAADPAAASTGELTP